MRAIIGKFALYLLVGLTVGLLFGRQERILARQTYFAEQWERNSRATRCALKSNREFTQSVANYVLPLEW